LRSDLNPRELKSLLSRLFILQHDSEDCYSYRLAGTELCRYFGHELRGENFLSNWQRNELQSITSLFHSITNDKTAAVLGVKAFDSELNHCLMEVLLLPVRLDGSKEVRVLGCASIFDMPPWIGRGPIAQQEITSLRLLWPDNVSRFMAQGPRLVEAEPDQDVFHDQHADGERRGHLWVIDGGAS
jgi:hypothetical protein